ncbi:hypothetical protein BXT86_04090 [candidate division WOR-3 bacterium 4484_100]|uniref:Uncharacterized protein n=1 Tax=candidate division WOR-3 bacterium 4484_100 TaxID=1936077 RepID=A0A1V4QEU0_UNCW3|nr:MAG: hypothetical protein BXT86_04090 [candidate division WOR-3 bacterium 4484_100]
MFEQLKNKDKITLPDWLSSGQDLFGTIQIIKGKKIELGYLEIDSEFTFSGTFNYPIIFIIRSSNSDIEADAIAFKIDKDKDTTQRAFNERLILAITEVLDQRRANTESDQGLN